MDVGFYVENLDNIFDYKASIEAGKDSFMLNRSLPFNGSYYYELPSPLVVYVRQIRI
jgi:hypothetical protein